MNKGQKNFSVGLVVVFLLIVVGQQVQVMDLKTRIDNLKTQIGEPGYVAEQEMIDDDRINSLYDQIAELRNEMAVVNQLEKRQKMIWNAFWLDYGEEEPAIALTWVHRQNIDEMWLEIYGQTRSAGLVDEDYISRIDWNRDQSAFFHRHLEDMAEAICKIEPEAYPLCAQ